MNFRNYTTESIVVYEGIITKFGVIKNLICDSNVRPANESEIKAYFKVNIKK